MSSRIPVELAREQILGGLHVLGNLEDQWAYERNVPIANVPAELCEAGDDLLGPLLAVPGVLSDLEVAAVDRVIRLIDTHAATLPSGLIQMQHDPRWIEIMAAARDAIEVISPGWHPPEREDPAMPNPVGSWGDYFASMEAMPLHPLYAELYKYLPRKGKALELAAGIGQGAVHLLEKGFDVWATDIHGEALTRLYERTPEALRPRLRLYVSGFDKLDLAPSKFDVVVAGFCLFFQSPELFARNWPIIAGAIRAKGLFMGQFLGVRDDWAAMGYTAQTRDEVLALLDGFEILHLEEAERDGKTSQGTDKHWHIFHVIARRVAPVSPSRTTT